MSAPAVPPPSALLLERGHELTSRLRAVAADLSSWCDELTADKPESVDARMHADEALRAIERAMAAVSVYTQIVAGMG